MVSLIDMVDKLWLRSNAKKPSPRRRDSMFSETSDCDEEATTHRLGANSPPAPPLRYSPPPPYEAQDALYSQERRPSGRVYQHPSINTDCLSTFSSYDDQDIHVASPATPGRASNINPSPSSSTSSKSSPRISYFTRWSSASTAPPSPTSPTIPVSEPVMIQSPPRHSGKACAKKDSTTSTVTSSNSSTLNRHIIDQAVTLASVAAEEEQKGNHQVALELYLTGLEKMLNALPVDTDPNSRRALQAKLAQFVDRNGLDLKEGTRDGLFSSFELKSSGVPEIVINAAVMGAIALKQSPIPNAISSTLSITIQTLQRIDAAYNVRGKAWEFTSLGLTRALELDAEYNLHGRVTEAVYTSFAAFIKASVAYTDAPGYNEVMAGRVNDEEKARLMNGKGRTANLMQDQYRRASVL